MLFRDLESNHKDGIRKVVTSDKKVVKKTSVDSVKSGRDEVISEFREKIFHIYLLVILNPSKNVRVGPKLDQISPKWDKSGIF